MPEAQITIKLKVQRYTLFDLMPIIPAVGVIVRIGKWWTMAVRLGPVCWVVRWGPLGWDVKFEVMR